MKKVKKIVKEEIPILKETERLKNTKMNSKVFDFMLKKLITMEDSTLYIKKPIPIKAFDFLETKKDNEGNNLFDGIEDNKYFINTLEGKMYIKEDDFVIIGIKGEKYPIKRDIFFETYKKYIPKNKNTYINK